MSYNLSYVDLGSSFNPVTIKIGSAHSCVVSDVGNVKCWGYNGYGQLGTADNIIRGNVVNQMGDNLSIINLGENFKVKELGLGRRHTCALSVSHQVKRWGYNVNGELGMNDTIQRGDKPGEMGDNLTAIKSIINQHLNHY